MTPRVAVVGHVEHIEFAVVDHLPRAGQVVHAGDCFIAPGGGGAVAAVQLRKLAGEAAFFTALGSDDIAAALRAELDHAYGVTVHAARRDRPHRRGFTHIDARTGERTITILGDRIFPTGADPLPWHELENADGVYLTAGDADAVRLARRARILVATVRAIDALADAHVEIDALVCSAADETERKDLARLDPAPRLVVVTDGERGGTCTAAGGTTTRWDAIPPPGPMKDAYGCGDTFAAGLTYGLAAGLGVDDALALGARCGAHCLTGRGPYAGQLASAQLSSARRSAS